MRQKKTKAMLKYWMELYENAGNEADKGKTFNWPERSDVQPSACRSLLGEMFILDTSVSKAAYRLAGTKLCALYGRELKNEEYCDIFSGKDRTSAENWITSLGRDGYAVLICSTGETFTERTVNLETLLLPLSHHGEPNSRILGITVATEMPQWLGSIPIARQTIRSVRVIRPWEEQRGIASAFRSNWPFDVPATIARDRGDPPARQKPRKIDARDFGLLTSPRRAEPHHGDHSEIPPTGRQVAHLTVFDGGRS